jgi:hypothetical protein
MPGLVPGIHVFLYSLLKKAVDGRVKPGHDEKEIECRPSTTFATAKPNGMR